METCSRKRPRSEEKKIHQLQLLATGMFSILEHGNDEIKTKTEEELLSKGLHPLLLQRVKNKGDKAKPTKLVGWSFGASSEQVLPHLAINVRQKFRCTLERGVPYALLNLLSASKIKKDRLIKCFGSVGSLADLCNPARHLFGKNLNPIKECSISWILEQPSGLFLVVDELHCVGVDCDRQLMFDSFQPYAMKLSCEALLVCGITKLDELRQIV
jgi:hypothetical protein